MLPLLFLLSASVKFNFYNSQYIDHVHPELGTFNHRFFSTWDQHFTDYPDSLIVFVGGNSPIDSVAQSIYNMPIFEIAKNTNSTLFILEHRFFGESKISNNTEFESLEFLTVDQAIDDIAQFITFIKNSYCKSIDCRVALAGEGYGGSLAVWAKQQYPGIVDSVWASSAPIVASNEHYGTDSYHVELLRLTFQKVTQNCSACLKILEDQLFSDQRDEIYRIYNLSDSMIEQNFLYAIANLIYDIIDKEEYKTIFYDFFNNGEYFYCEELPEKVAKALRFMEKNDISYFDPTWPKDSSNPEMRDRRFWTYLQCQELGWIGVSPPSGIQNRILQRSVNSSSVYTNVCRELFNSQHANINYFNTRHGGRQPGVNSVIYTTAKKQVWGDLTYIGKVGAENEITSKTFTDLFEKSAMKSYSIDDSKDLIDARTTAVETLSSWLSSKECLHGFSALHQCVCDDGFAGKYCDEKSRTKEFNKMSQVAILIPTILMFFVGAISWCVFFESTKKNIKQII